MYGHRSGMEDDLFRLLRRHLPLQGKALGLPRGGSAPILKSDAAARTPRGLFHGGGASSPGHRFYASIVLIVSVVSSSTSSSTRTVSREVNMVTLFSVAARRIFTPSERASLELRLRGLMT